nr:TetR family transcriptional regulator [Mycobacterium kansasii]
MSTTENRSKLRERQRLSTRELIMAAAKQCVREGGYAAATVEQIAEVAGVARATFYLHFKSKAALARAVIDDLRQRSRPKLAHEEGASVSHDELVALIRSWIRFYRAEVDGFRLWHEAVSVDVGVDSMIDAAESSVVSAVAGHTAWSNRVLAARADLIAAMMVLQLDRLCYAWFISGWKMRESEVVDETVRAWEGYYIPRLRELAELDRASGG